MPVNRPDIQIAALVAENPALAAIAFAGSRFRLMLGTTIIFPMRGHVTMMRKRSRTFHEKRVRFFTFLFGLLGVLGFCLLLLLVNHSPYHVH